jgi:rhodanese-related sulfurtransferase
MSLHLRLGFLAVCLACCFLVSPFRLAQGQSLSPATTVGAVPSISAQDLKALIAEKKPIFILDVRQKEEYDAGHIDNAVLIPLNVLLDRYNELPKDKTIVVYCGSGGRAARAVTLLGAKGFTNAVRLSGGFTAWEELQKTGK